MKKIKIIFLGTLIVCMFGLLTACNTLTGKDTDNNNGNGTITTTAGKNDVNDDIKDGAMDIATDMGIDNDNDTDNDSTVTTTK